MPCAKNSALKLLISEPNSTKTDDILENGIGLKHQSMVAGDDLIVA